MGRTLWAAALIPMVALLAFAQDSGSLADATPADNVRAGAVRERAPETERLRRLPDAGRKLASLDSALDKLALGAAGTPIDEALVRTLLDDTRARSIFELTSQLGEGDAAGGVNSVRRLLDSGESAIGMVAMIARHFRIVWRVQDGRAKGLSGRALAAHAGCPPKFLSEYERDAGRFTPMRDALHHPRRVRHLVDELLFRHAARSLLLLDGCDGSGGADRAAHGVRLR